ncbi:MAG TPA: DciA family protein, partial [Pyrinomonadaceae bacterium]
MDDLFKTLSAVLRLVGNDPQVIEAAAIAAWKKAAGDGLRQHAIPLRLTDGTLVVAVADGVWQKQLGAM